MHPVLLIAPNRYFCWKPIALEDIIFNPSCTVPAKRGLPYRGLQYDKGFG
jgi:hypothetical protein